MMHSCQMEFHSPPPYSSGGIYIFRDRCDYGSFVLTCLVFLSNSIDLAFVVMIQLPKYIICPVLKQHLNAVFSTYNHVKPLGFIFQ